jgi:GxxExxY protein
MNPNRSEDGENSPCRANIVEKDLSHAIVACFFEVYNELGYGYLESLYARGLEITLRRCGLRVEREYAVVVTFQGEPIGFHRVDMLVERRVIVEVKSTERLPLSAHRQLRSYVKALDLELGILLHFGPNPQFFRQLRRRPPNATRSDSDSFG